MQGAMYQYTVRRLWRAAVAVQPANIVSFLAHRQCSIDSPHLYVLSQLQEAASKYFCALKCTKLSYKEARLEN